MSVETYRGTLRDFAGSNIQPDKPQLAFYPLGGMAVSGQALLTTQPIYAAISTAGLVTVQLESGFEYQIVLSALDNPTDIANWRMYASAGGGTFNDVMGDEGGSGFQNNTWVGETDNPNYEFWFQPSTQDLYGWSAS